MIMLSVLECGHQIGGGMKICFMRYLWR